MVTKIRTLQDTKKQFSVVIRPAGQRMKPAARPHRWTAARLGNNFFKKTA
jgi:hypothetical protein